MTIQNTPWHSSLEPAYSNGNEILLLEGGRAFFPELEARIQAANQEVLLETYIYENDASGKKITEALAQAAERGVKVYVIVDGYGSKTLAQEVIDRFNQSGVLLQVYRPEKKRITLERQRLRRLHRKLALIDSSYAFVGGINVLDDFYDPNHGALMHPRFDFAIRARGPMVAAIHLSMKRLWWQLLMMNRALNSRFGNRSDTEATARVGMPESVNTVVQTQGHFKAKFVLRDNFRFRRAIEKSYLRAVGRAHREVLISNAYFFPGERFRRALVMAARRGVRVRLLLQGVAEYQLQHWATQALYKELLKEGIEIYEYNKSFLHAKVALADNWVTVGSSNIDPFSLLMAREANAVILNQDFSDQLRGRLEQAIEDGAVKVCIEEFARHGIVWQMLRRLSYRVLRIAIAFAGISGRY